MCLENKYEGSVLLIRCARVDATFVQFGGDECELHCKQREERTGTLTLYSTAFCGLLWKRDAGWGSCEVRGAGEGKLPIYRELLVRCGLGENRIGWRMAMGRMR